MTLFGFGFNRNFFEVVIKSEQKSHPFMLVFFWNGLLRAFGRVEVADKFRNKDQPLCPLMMQNVCDEK